MAAHLAIPTSPPQPLTHYDMLRAAGVPEDQLEAADFIITHEGNYDPCIINGGARDCSYSGFKAYGVCQSLPGSKMASAGEQWRTDPVTQIAWCHSYAVSRYGSWMAAKRHWLATHWW